MQIISKEVCTINTTMSVIHSEKGAFRPLLIRSWSRLHNVQNYWHSVFIVIPDKSLVCIRCILQEKKGENTNVKNGKTKEKTLLN